MFAVDDPTVAPAAELTQPEHDRLFNRPPRIRHALPHDELVIPPPPADAARAAGPQLAMVLLPLLTALMYVGLMLANGGQSGRPATIPVIGGSLLSGGLGLYSWQRRRQLAARQRQAQAQGYDRLLDALRSRLQQLTQLQRALREANDPDLAQLERIVSGPDEDMRPQPAARLWERRPCDDDFLRIRVGRAALPTTVALKPPQADQIHYSAALGKAQALAAEFAVVPDVPLTVQLRTVGSLGIAGPSGTVRAHARALLWQIAVHHSPKDVRILALWDTRYDPSWEWLRWLPHTSPLDDDDTYRLLAHLDGPSAPLAQVLAVLASELQQRHAQPERIATQPHLLVVLGSALSAGPAAPVVARALREGSRLGCSVLCLVDAARDVPGECGAYVDLAAAPTLAVAGPGGGYHPFTPDHVDHHASSRLARTLAPIVPTESDAQRELPRSVRLLPLLGIADALAYDPWQLWSRLPADSWHPVPCGLRSATTPLQINLNEGFDGVHGMIAGTTGSGKSEFLLTFLLALALAHSPDRVNFMLIDFKGGATFQGLDALPHTAGIVTDLQGNLAERALIAINSELDRRKQRLARASSSSDRADVPNIRAYRKQGFEHQPDFGPLPNLLIAIDEFDEMVRDYPEFVAELVRVAKQGRSLGVHLLFATQQPSAIKEGLTRNLTYWVALRVTSADDSRLMIGAPDAAFLTTETPGRGYVRVGKQLTSFQSARVTVPYRRPRGGGELGVVDVTGRWQPLAPEDRRLAQLRRSLADALGAQSTPDEALLQQLARRCVALYAEIMDEPALPCAEQTAAQQAAVESLLRQHWAAPDADSAQPLVDLLLESMAAAPPPEQEITLVAQKMSADPTTGLGYAARRYPIWTAPLSAELHWHELPEAHEPEPRWLSAPLGLLDLPAEAQQRTCQLQLAEQHGNLLVLGAARSGKTTCVRTLITALALRHTPDQLWIYLIDPSGFGCGFVAASATAESAERTPLLPHIADVLSPAQTPRIERLLIELQEQIRRRQALLQAYGLDALAQLYAQPPARRPEELPPAIVVVVDNVAELAAAQPEAMETLKSLLRETRKCGIAFVVTGYTWREVAALQASFETRIALRLNDPVDSDAMLGKPFAARIAAEQPGRGFLRTPERPLELQVALPMLPTGPSPAAPSDFQGLLRAIARRYPAAGKGFPQPLRSLPARVTAAELNRACAAAPSFGLALALDGLTLQPIMLDLAVTPHLLVAGGPRSGKAELLRTILSGLAARYGPDTVRFALVDYRRRALKPFTQLEHAWPVRVPAQAAAAEPRTVTLVTCEAEVRALVAELAAEMARRAEGERGPHIVLAISNWDVLQDTTSLWKPLAQWMLQGRDLGLHLVVTGAEYSGFTSTDMLKLARLERCAAFLGAPAENSMVPGTIGIKLPRNAAQLELPPGRGFLALGGPAQLVQFALAEPPAGERATTDSPTMVGHGATEGLAYD